MKIRILTTKRLLVLITFACCLCAFLFSCGELGTEDNPYSQNIKKNELKTVEAIESSIIGKWYIEEGKFESFEFLENRTYIIVERKSTKTSAVKALAKVVDGQEVVYLGNWEIRDGKIYLSNFGVISGVSAFSLSGLEIRLGFEIDGDKYTLVEDNAPFGNDSEAKELSKFWTLKKICPNNNISDPSCRNDSYTVLFTLGGTYLVLKTDNPVSPSEVRIAEWDWASSGYPNIKYEWKGVTSGTITIEALTATELVIKEGSEYFIFEQMVLAPTGNGTLAVGKTLTGSFEQAPLLSGCTYVFKADDIEITDCNGDLDGSTVSCELTANELNKSITFEITCDDYEAKSYLYNNGAKVAPAEIIYALSCTGTLTFTAGTANTWRPTVMCSDGTNSISVGYENNGRTFTSALDWDYPIVGTYDVAVTANTGNCAEKTANCPQIVVNNPPTTPNNSCTDYDPSWCGNAAFASVTGNTTSVPTTGQCFYIGNFKTIQPTLNSTVSINGVSNPCGGDWNNCSYNNKPDTKDGGYYVYVKSGSVNTWQGGGWAGIIAKEKPNCNTGGPKPPVSGGCAYQPSWCDGNYASSDLVPKPTNSTDFNNNYRQQGKCFFVRDVNTWNGNDADGGKLWVNGTSCYVTNRNGGQTPDAKCNSIPKADGGYYIYAKNTLENGQWAFSYGAPICSGGGVPSSSSVASSSSVTPSSSSVGGGGCAYTPDLCGGLYANASDVPYQSKPSGDAGNNKRCVFLTNLTGLINIGSGAVDAAQINGVNCGGWKSDVTTCLTNGTKDGGYYVYIKENTYITALPGATGTAPNCSGGGVPSSSSVASSSSAGGGNCISATSVTDMKTKILIAGCYKHSLNSNIFCQINDVNGCFINGTNIRNNQFMFAKDKDYTITGSCPTNTCW